MLLIVANLLPPRTSRQRPNQARSKDMVGDANCSYLLLIMQLIAADYAELYTKRASSRCHVARTPPGASGPSRARGSPCRVPSASGGSAPADGRTRGGPARRPVQISATRMQIATGCCDLDAKCYSIGTIGASCCNFDSKCCNFNADPLQIDSGEEPHQHVS